MILQILVPELYTRYLQSPLYRGLWVGLLVLYVIICSVLLLFISMHWQSSIRY